MLQAPDRRRNPNGVPVAIVSKAQGRRGVSPNLRPIESSRIQSVEETGQLPEPVNLATSVSVTSKNKSRAPNSPATLPLSARTRPIIAITSDNEYFDICHAGEGRGLGVFAKKHIDQGTRILAEKPQFIVDLEAFSRSEIRLALENSTFSSCIPAALAIRSAIHMAFKKMNAADQAKVLELHCPHKTSDWRLDIIAIVKANAFHHGTNGAAICAEASRFNHACVPNAHFGWNPQFAAQTFQIIKTGGVEAGDEITVCYDKPEAGRESRQKVLHETYGFTCTCDVCDKTTPRGKASSRRRAEMAMCAKKMLDFDSHPKEARVIYGTSEPLAAVLRMERLSIEEGLVGVGLARICHRAAVLLRERQRRAEAKEMAEKEVRVYIYCIGTEHPKTAEAKEFFRSI